VWSQESEEAPAGDAQSEPVHGGFLIVQFPEIANFNCRREIRHRLSYGSYSTPNASNTLPPIPPRAGYPDTVYSMPPATTGPATSIAPPCPATPFTVLNSRAVSKSQMMC